MNKQNKRLVLDAGSGHNPYPSANILCDLFPKPTEHRQYLPLNRNGKPFICCSVEALPFRCNVISFVWCSHVIEHVESPVQALKELRRVARHGRVIVPSRIWEFLSREFKPHIWVIHGQKAVSSGTGWMRVVNTIRRLLWNKNWRIRLRERVRVWGLLRRCLQDQVISKW